MSLRTLKRRRLEKKTDYKLRMGLLKSKNPRIVIRKTNKYIILQVVESKESQDKISTGVTSKDLLENGWDKKYEGSLKSIPAAYLTGLLLAKKVGKGKFIIDMGMLKNIAGSRIYAAAKGLVDGGLDININESVFPPEERLNGEHLKDELKSLIKKVKDKLKNGK
ncbi:MAG: 50S ribosomal protein L18 [Nanoarchaeota archaeon]|nr:50S ribosomal protein L18 [Nanoarchaeota archaeon]